MAQRGGGNASLYERFDFNLFIVHCLVVVKRNPVYPFHSFLQGNSVVRSNENNITFARTHTYTHTHA